MKIDPDKDLQEKENPFNERYSVIFAAGLFVIFFTAVISFYYGHRVAMNSFLKGIDEEAFSDKILYSLYNINGLDQEEETEDSLDEAGKEATVEIEVIQEVVETGDMPQEEREDGEVLLADRKPGISTDEKNLESQSEETVIYAAPLIGFGTLHAAQDFSARLQKQGISVIIKQRSSTTPRGKKIQWYQVVTPEFSSRKDLEKLIDLIQKHEKLQNVTIVEKRKVHAPC